MQPASPGILGICVRTSATVPSISVTESIAVEEMHQVEVFVKIWGTFFEYLIFSLKVFFFISEQYTMDITPTHTHTHTRERERDGEREREREISE